MTVVRPVNEIQADLLSAAEVLHSTTQTIGLVKLMTELERSYPAEMNLERVGEGEICPPLAWEVHADVGNAKILLEEVIESLHKAAARTEHEVRQEWRAEKLGEIKDASARALLAHLIYSGVESGA